MLPLLIIFIMLIYVCVGYYIAAKIDINITGNNFAAETAVEEGKGYPVAVVFGNTELTKQLGILLGKNQIHMRLLTEPFLFEKKQSIQYLFALSENDTDNIVLYKIGSKIYGIERMICICNDYSNKCIYTKEKIAYICDKNITAEMLYEAVIVGKEI